MGLAWSAGDGRRAKTFDPMSQKRGSDRVSVSGFDEFSVKRELDDVGWRLKSAKHCHLKI
ncbi:hypothetical protein WK91_19775 [Burkholderia cepacia]|nr:hypothetical protein WK91_19775 [Burkholderia cepacia]